MGSSRCTLCICAGNTAQAWSLGYVLVMVDHQLPTHATLMLMTNPQAQYVVGTLLLGFPVISSMRGQVQEARIESIMKGK